MIRTTIVLLGTLSLVACTRDRSADKAGETTTTGASTDAGISVESVRLKLIEGSPKGADALTNIDISNDDGIVTLRGKVDDESSKRDMLNAVRSMPNVKSVRDELLVAPKSPHPGSMQYGQPGSTEEHGMLEGIKQGAAGAKQGAIEGKEAMTEGIKQGAAGAKQGAIEGKEAVTEGAKQGAAGAKQGAIEGKEAVTEGAKQGAAGAKQGAIAGMKEGKLSAAQTKAVNAVRSHLTQEKAAPAAVLSELKITDEGGIIVLSGNVPDEATHAAVLTAAHKTPGLKGLRDELKIKAQ
jgi:osmotically-inducible protein OsmY